MFLYCSHERTHSKQRPFECKPCNLAFKNKTLLKTHWKSITHAGDAATSECTLCGKKISTKYLDIHVKKHMEKTKNNRGKVRLKRRKKNDMESDNSDDDFEVKSDGVADCKEENLVDDEEAGKPNKCETCGLRFRSKRALDKHSAEHIDKGRYVCQECLECFEDLRALKEHRWTHGEGMAKRIKCEFCPLRFTSKRGLDKHVKITHGEDEYVSSTDAFAELKDIPCDLDLVKKEDISSTDGLPELKDIQLALDMKMEEDSKGQDSTKHDNKCLC